MLVVLVLVPIQPARTCFPWLRISSIVFPSQSPTAWGEPRRLRGTQSCRRTNSLGSDGFPADEKGKTLEN